MQAQKISIQLNDGRGIRREADRRRRPERYCSVTKFRIPAGLAIHVISDKLRVSDFARGGVGIRLAPGKPPPGLFRAGTRA